MTTSSYSLFDTALGRCALAWQGEAVVATALPGVDDAALRATIRRRCPPAAEAVPAGAAAAAIRAIAALLAGERLDLAGIAVRTEGASAFERRVYDETRTIPPGETLTYGEMADRIGEPGAARAVGVALGRNPVPIVVPCHRVLAASGRTGGFSAPGGVATKMRLLTLEARHAPEHGLFGVLPLQARPPAAAPTR